MNFGGMYTKFGMQMDLKHTYKFVWNIFDTLTITHMVEAWNFQVISGIFLIGIC
jgi:hypothetical protein